MAFFAERELLDIYVLCGSYHAISYAANAAGVDLEPGAPTFTDHEPTEVELAREPPRPMGMRTRTPIHGVLATAVLMALATGCGSDSDGPTSSGVGGPITVEQLIARSADTPIAVQGLLHVDQGVARLCAAILESHPPQCGEPSVELVGLKLSSVEGTTTAQGVTWKEAAVLNLERAADGRFTVVDVVIAGFDVQVVLGLYSGVPDPAWTLTAEQANELAAALAGLTRVDAPAATGGLGYHGFTIVTADGTLVAYEGKVLSADSDPPYVLDDPDRTIERLLLGTAQPHVTADELRTVADALGQP